MKPVKLPPDSIVAMDRGYLDYGMFGEWTERGVWFVTRLKRNAAYEIVERREVPQRRKILADEIIRLTTSKGETQCPYALSRVQVWEKRSRNRSSC